MLVINYVTVCELKTSAVLTSSWSPKRSLVRSGSRGLSTVRQPWLRTLISSNASQWAVLSWSGRIATLSKHILQLIELHGLHQICYCIVCISYDNFNQESISHKWPNNILLFSNTEIKFLFCSHVSRVSNVITTKRISNTSPVHTNLVCIITSKMMCYVIFTYLA